MPGDPLTIPGAAVRLSALRMVPATAWFQALRSRQWAKNTVVVAAPIFALRFDERTIVLGVAAFVAFCAASSATYLVNDVRDVEADRLHPVKRSRPVAAGIVPVPLALALAGGLLGAGLLVAWAVGTTFLMAVVAYLAVQAAYNAGLKHEPILDMMCIAAGFVIRAIGGALAVRVAVSGWFLLCLGLLALFFAIEKRRAEMQTVARAGGPQTRAVLQSYSPALLAGMESVATASALVSYALWAIDQVRSPWMLATLGFVAYALFRYQMLTERGEGESPERELLRSPHIVAAVLLWLGSSVTILFLLRR